MNPHGCAILQSMQFFLILASDFCYHVLAPKLVYIRFFLYLCAIFRA